MKKNTKFFTDFVVAVSTFDTGKLENYLSEGEKTFEIKSNYKVGKAQFLNWLYRQLMEFQLENPKETIPFEFDRCTGCEAGKTVVIFDEGRFPKQEPNALFRYTAWKIEVEKGLITGITFCHSTEKLRTHEDYAF
ncbi:MAG: hypothetical protein K9I02_06765 [Haliscomenobacter sp.]|nr:hypothetical protein [Haliscomenobacter sp.]